MNYSIRKCKGRNWGLARHTGCGLGDWALWEILTGFRSSNLQDFFCLRSGDAIPHNLLGPLTSPASLGWSWLGSPEIARREFAERIAQQDQADSAGSIRSSPVSSSGRSSG